MLLIATDEAGYGPKLGPLVIAATSWQLPEVSMDELDGLFQPLRQPTDIGNSVVTIDDSKSVFQPGADNALAALHAAVSACAHWSDAGQHDVAGLIAAAARHDMTSINNTPWLQNLDGINLLEETETSNALKQWSAARIRCERMLARVITAKVFNEACTSGMNKADLLSESTIGLVRELVPVAGDTPTVVFCDRHGGRRYYAGVLQHVFGDGQVQVVGESKSQSVYKIFNDRYDIRIHFTVKGDTFTPVAMSSMFAKYIRERMMDSLNEYFCQRHCGDEPLKPTAGYPTDANRFLKQIEPIIEREQMDLFDLVRNR